MSAHGSAPGRATGGAKSEQLGSGLDGAESTEPRALDGRYHRDVGARLAENSVHTIWRLGAEGALERLAETGDEFTADDLHRACGSPPGHANSVGSLFLTAAKRDLIEPVGYRQSTRPQAHARAIRVWRGTGRKPTEVPR